MPGSILIAGGLALAIIALWLAWGAVIAVRNLRQHEEAAPAAADVTPRWTRHTGRPGPRQMEHLRLIQSFSETEAKMSAPLGEPWHRAAENGGGLPR